jgi:hypothetical protein
MAWKPEVRMPVAMPEALLQIMASGLIARIVRDGQVETDSELELLINVLEREISASGDLYMFALKEMTAPFRRAFRHGPRYG